MIEKTSKDIKCVVCGAPATSIIAGLPCCDNCVDNDKIKEAQETIESFQG